MKLLIFIILSSSAQLSQNIEILLQKRKEIRQKYSSRDKLKDKLKKIDDSVYLEMDLPQLVEDKVKVVETKSPFEMLQELVSPLLSSLKRISEKPRKVEELKNKIANIDKFIFELSSSVKKLDNIQDKHLIEDKDYYIKKLSERLNNLQLEKELLATKLSKIDSNKKSFIEEITVFLKEFFSTRGKNLLYSFLVFILIWRGTHFIGRKILINKKFQSKDVWFHRTISLLTYVLSFLFGITGSLIILYLRHDWFLVSSILLIFFLIFWSFRQYLPNYLREMRYLLNLGTVRVGEMVHVDGINFIVSKIGPVSLLENPLLSDGHIRPNPSEIYKKSSFPYDEKSLFPTKVGDWLLFNNNLVQVMYQSLHYIHLEAPSKRKTIISTLNFLAESIIVLNHGYLIKETLSVTYSLGLDLWERMLNSLNHYMKSSIDSELLQKDIKCDFSKAGESSLDIVCLLYVKGEYANKYYSLKREVQTYLSKFCFENNIEIPFPQVTLSGSLKADGASIKDQ